VIKTARGRANIESGHLPLALGQYSRNFGKSASLLTSMPVTICIIYYTLQWLLSKS